ncbi:MAG: PEP-CTERM sorting domain-containing protein [Kiritimatiellae bacterium]|nr:PEP-CTERM sorting domain-containing protein [Kiritimatiellia bacterium]
MKKIIAILAVGFSLALHADYLYWMVNTADATDGGFNTYTSVRLNDGNTTIDRYDFGAVSDLTTYQEGGGYFTYAITGSYTDSTSFFVELYNGEKWVAESAKLTYAELVSRGSIFKGGLQPANITPANFGSYAVPEPTSGLLFLVGGMLLGLKRRRQKV